MQHFNLFTVFCLTVILGILPTITLIRSVACAFAKPLAVGTILAISACGGGGGGTAATSPSGNMPGDGMSPMTIPLPTPSSARTLADLNAYDTPTPLTPNQIRPGGAATGVGSITGFRYDDAVGNQQVRVEKLDFAHLGIWIVGTFADNNFLYESLNENVVTLATDFSGLATAVYLLDGNMTYKGIQMYPFGNLTLNFTNETFAGNFSIFGESPLLYFGDANAMVLDSSGEMRPVTANDLIEGNFAGTEITANGFNGNWEITSSSGFFDDIPLMTFTDAVNGRFHHGSNYQQGTTLPTEVSGTFNGIIDSGGNEMRGGFLGQLE